MIMENAYMSVALQSIYRRRIMNSHCYLISTSHLILLYCSQCSSSKPRTLSLSLSSPSPTAHRIEFDYDFINKQNLTD